MRYRKNIGDIGEQLAADMLSNDGYRIVARNYLVRDGDVITQILIQTNSRGHPLNVLVPRRLADKCSRYSFKKVSYPIDRLRLDK